MSRRLLHITNRPTPYRLPWFRELDRQLAGDGWRFGVLFLGNGRARRQWKIDEEELRGIDVVGGDWKGGGLRRALRAVLTERPELVTLAWAMDATALVLLLFCRLLRIRTIVLCGESAWSAAATRLAAPRRLARRLFFRLADGFLSYGESSSDYLRSAGLPEGRLTTGLNMVDTRFFRDEVEQRRRQNGASEGESFHLLFVGYLLPAKGLAQVLKAMTRPLCEEVILDVVGDGTERERLEAVAGELGLAERVRFHGYCQTNDLPPHYAAADALVFPSLWEVFGLVMIEGVAAGLPVIASSRAGGSREAVVDGLNGLVVDPLEVDDLAAAIAALAGDPELRAAMAAASRRRCSELLTLEESARRYRRAVARATAGSSETVPYFQT